MLGILFGEQVRDHFSPVNAQVVALVLEREVNEHKEELVVNMINNIRLEGTLRTQRFQKRHSGRPEVVRLTWRAYDPRGCNFRRRRTRILEEQ
jgi:hypothetical protein